MTDQSIPLQEIEKTYSEEYYQTQRKAHKGFWGKVDRFFAFLDDKEHPENRAFFRHFSPACMVGFPLLFTPAPYTWPLLAVLLPLALIASRVSSYALEVVEKAAKNKLQQDITNGTLLKRYVEEILKPRQTRLLDKAEATSKVIATISATFTTVAAASAPAPEAPAPTLPEPKL
jgi:hypothetical protein